MPCEVFEYDNIFTSLMGENGKSTFDPILWKQARLLAYEQAKEITKGICIMDDNFHYKSMRKDFYRLAKDL